MARVSPKQHSFGRGEICEKLYGRQDTELYFTAVKQARNYVVDGRGILERRPGTKLLGRTKNNGAATLLPFVYDAEQSYILEMGNLYLRAWFDDGQVLTGGLPSETITPYSVTDAAALSYTQLRDVMWLANKNHPLKNVTRTGATTFTMTDFELLDGPYDDLSSSGASITPSGHTSLSPIMTSNSTPAPYIVSSVAASGNLTLWNAFDKNSSTEFIYGSPAGDIVFDPNASVSLDGYSLKATAIFPERMPSSWTIEGFDGANWIVIDSQNGQTSFSDGETRRFSIASTASFSKYRIVWGATGNSLSLETRISEVDFHIRPVNQTPISLTFSSIAGVNNGAGFDANDVGRSIRFLTSDGSWRWARIAGVSSTSVVTVRIYDQSLPSLAAFSTWRLGALRGAGGPSVVTFHDNRLVLALGNRVFFSQAGAYNKFGPTDLDGTINPDNAITVSIPATNSKKGAVSEVTFMQSIGFQLIVGTPSGLHTLQSSSFGEPLKPDSITRRPQDSRGSALGNPIVVGDSVIYLHSSRRKLMGTYYKDSYDRIGAQDLSLPADHLTTALIKGVTWQEEPHSIAWLHMDDGTVAGLTIQPEEKVQAWHSHRLGGSFISGGAWLPAQVESMATIPSSDGAGDRLHMVVKRTIDGSTARFVEVMRPYWTIGDDVRNAWFVDAGIKYEGNTDPAKTITFTGSGVSARSAVTNFASPAMVDGQTLVFHDGVRWHHGTVSGVDGSNDFTWTPTAPNAGPGPADGRWHYVNGAWSQLANDADIDIYVSTYVPPANQTAVARWSTSISTITGLADFEGESLSLLVDGFHVSDKVVDSGEIVDLPSCHVLTVGFGFASQGRLLSIEAGSQNGSAQGKQRPVYEQVLDLLEHGAIEGGTGLPTAYGRAWEQFSPITYPEGAEPLYGTPAPLFTGLARMIRDEQGRVDDPSVAWRQSDTLPGVVRGVITRLSESDGR